MIADRLQLRMKKRPGIKAKKERRAAPLLVRFTARTPLRPSVGGDAKRSVRGRCPRSEQGNKPGVHRPAAFASCSGRTESHAPTF